MEQLEKKYILTENDFVLHPIWTWDSTKEYKIPITGDDEQEAEGLFVKAKFSTNGYSFNGYLIGDTEYYAFVVFVGSGNLIFNSNAKNLNKESLEKLFALLKCEPFSFFPVEYELDIPLENEREKISGFLNFEI